ncbi:MAG: hypothetical protein K6T65_12020 [Peptococcaceae bacterium]|nr:hypothetical protein [Peptococcaceae bacterium]
MDCGRTVEMAKAINNIRREVERLRDLGAGINCVEKNIERMSACLRMLELNVNDAVDLATAGDKNS